MHAFVNLHRPTTTDESVNPTVDLRSFVRRVYAFSALRTYVINGNRKRSEDLQVQRETESVIAISLLSQSRNEDYSSDFFWYPGERRQIIFARYSIQFWINLLCY